MEPGPSTRNAQMPFDNFTRTQGSFSSSLVSKPDTVVWQMPPPSNPGLQRLMDNANKDVSRINPPPSESNWNFLPSVVATDAVGSSSRPSTRLLDKRLHSITSFEINPAIAKLVDPVMLKGVADAANQKAQERSRTLGLVMKRRKSTPKSTKAEKSTTGKSRASRAVNSGMIEKSRNVPKRKERGKTKEISGSSLLQKSWTRECSTFKRPVFDDSFSITSSSTSSPEVLDDSMSIDETNSPDTSLMSPSPPLLTTRLPNPHTTLSLSAEISNAPAVDSGRQPPLSNGTRAQRARNAHSREARSVPIVTSKIPPKAIQVPALPVVPPPMSHPLPSANPPALGMRRVNSFPAKNVRLIDNIGVVRDLPTKQRPFKTPFLPTTQRSNTGQALAVNATYPKTEKSPVSRMNDVHREAFAHTIEETEPHGMVCDDAETSYEHDSFDMDALEETLKQYD
ncbi:uncharacterized protein C8R40DRAFT_1235788 [Lentinula edodes]|uniref:uncharacterized protein n=1 Tax=Lentinula edodes TaxID=5353 RepID=UPI001E8DDDAB|nr:uncharacterized protein C8R40DRAFT_1235788 [Lentinula edodes]KAH7877616.1 hypothetical protein C8R40DRAFT_1235788 [Lentinula edodes]